MHLHSMYAAACTPTHSFHIAIFQRELRWQQLQNWMRWPWMSGDKIITCSRVKKNYATMQLCSDVKKYFVIVFPICVIKLIKNEYYYSSYERRNIPTPIKIQANPKKG